MPFASLTTTPSDVDFAGAAPSLALGSAWWRLRGCGGARSIEARWSPSPVSPGRSELVLNFVSFPFSFWRLGSCILGSEKGASLCVSVTPSCVSFSSDGLAWELAGPVMLSIFGLTSACSSAGFLLTTFFCLVLTCFVLILSNVLSFVQHFKKARCTKLGPAPPSPAPREEGTVRRWAQRYLLQIRFVAVFNGPSSLIPILIKVQLSPSIFFLGTLVVLPTLVRCVSFRASRHIRQWFTSRIIRPSTLQPSLSPAFLGTIGSFRRG